MLLGCQSTPDGYFLPTNHLSGSGPGALIRGTIEIDDGCLYVHEADTDSLYLILWPQGSSMQQDANGVYVASDGRTIREGSEVALGGAAYSDFPNDQSDSDSVPCSGPWWLATDVMQGQDS
jgi:hypothetical protein